MSVAVNGGNANAEADLAEKKQDALQQSVKCRLYFCTMTFSPVDGSHHLRNAKGKEKENIPSVE